MTATMDLIAQASGTGTSPLIAFTNIPQSYKDLILEFDVVPTNSSGYLMHQFNNDGSSIHSATILYGNGSSAVSERNSNVGIYRPFGTNFLTNSSRTVGHLHVFNYSSTNMFKTMLSRISNPSQAAIASVGLYRSTNAITVIELSTGNPSTSWGNTSVCRLWGVVG